MSRPLVKYRDHDRRCCVFPPPPFRVAHQVTVKDGGWSLAWCCPIKHHKERTTSSSESARVIAGHLCDTLKPRSWSWRSLPSDWTLDTKLNYTSRRSISGCPPYTTDKAVCGTDRPASAGHIPDSHRLSRAGLAGLCVEPRLEPKIRQTICTASRFDGANCTNTPRRDTGANLTASEGGGGSGASPTYGSGPAPGCYGSGVASICWPSVPRSTLFVFGVCDGSINLCVTELSLMLPHHTRGRTPPTCLLQLCGAAQVTQGYDEHAIACVSGSGTPQFLRVCWTDRHLIFIPHTYWKDWNFEPSRHVTSRPITQPFERSRLEREEYMEHSTCCPKL